MSNLPLDTSFIDKAIHFAVDAHAGTERRCKGYPYVIHCLEAMSIVATMTNDKEVLAAAAIHDTVEDTGITMDDIRREFGEKVAYIVYVDTVAAEEGDWIAQKKVAMDKIRNASRDAKIAALGDKLSNMRGIARDYRVKGDKVWDMFHAPGGKPDHIWHYQGLRDALRELEDTEAFKEFSSLIDEVFPQE